MDQLLSYMQSNLVLIPSSLVISFTAFIVAGSLFSKATRSAGGLSFLLLASCSIILGCALWTTNLIWMINSTAKYIHRFDTPSVFGGLALSISVTYAGLNIAALQRTVLFRAFGGMIVGIGVFIMHYASLFSLDIINFDTTPIMTIALLLAVGISFPAMAFAWSIAVGSYYPKIVSSAIAAAGLLIFQKAGFSGISFLPSQARATLDGLDDGTLLTFILVISSIALTLGVSNFLLFHFNQIDRKKENEQISGFDTLTGLPNRVSLQNALNDILSRRDQKTALVSFDFSRFKTINEVHGRNAGDYVLKFLTTRVKDTLKANETLFRVGGDEFVAVKDDISSAYEALEFAKRIRDAAINEISWEGKLLSVGISLGIAIAPTDDDHGEGLIAKANLAMSRAKNETLGQPIFYDPAKDDENLERSALSIDLRNAIANDEFKLFYQRQNNIQDGSLVGYEVLLRWAHPQFGFVSPEVFIPIAEQSDLIIEIGEWVLQKACFEAASWHHQTKIAVNVAAKQLANDKLPETIARILTASGLPASRLEIEITESGVIADMDHASFIVSEIKKLGVSIAMDDFGVGYSSLSLFQFLPFDKLKIDKGFIKGITTDGPKQAIVKSTILLGKNLNITILAEGVENKEELAFLREQGCDYVQGYLFGRPISSDIILSTVAA